MDSRVLATRRWRRSSLQLPTKSFVRTSEERLIWPRRACEASPRLDPKVDRRALLDSPEPLQILLVDDTYSNRRLVELILRQRGHRVLAVSDANSAIEAAQEGSWDVILMDLQMPLMNGWEATAAIRRAEQAEGRRPVPIIALTAYTIAGNRERSMEVGMDDFLTKPIDPKVLSEAVELFGRCHRNLDN
jgi:two-component system, sensor histidine kinase and response regulator